MIADALTVSVTLDDGAQTRLTQWGSAGPAIVCVHGMTSSRFSWTRFAHRFADRFRVFAYDQRGHGDCAEVRGPMSLKQGDADLRAVCDAIDGDILTLAGHSWGGAVVLRGGRTTRTHRVIAVDPMMLVASDVDWHDEFVSDLESDNKLSAAELEKTYETRYARNGWGAEDIDAKRHAVREMTIEPLQRLGSENDVRAGGWDLRDVVRDYPKPLLLCLAQPADSTMTVAEREWVVKHGGPLVTQLVYEGHGHNLYRTAFDWFATDVERWLAAPMQR